MGLGRDVDLTWSTYRWRAMLVAPSALQPLSTTTIPHANTSLDGLGGWPARDRSGSRRRSGRADVARQEAAGSARGQLRRTRRWIRWAPGIGDLPQSVRQHDRRGARPCSSDRELADGDFYEEG